MLKKSNIKSFFQKTTSLFLIFQLTFFQSLSLLLPALVQARVPATSSSVSYDADSHQLLINSAGKIGDNYRLYYQHGQQIEAVTGQLSSEKEAIYLGTCSAADCIPAEVERLVLKLVDTQVDTQRLIISGNKIEADQSYVSAAADLTAAETNWLAGKTDGGWVINDDSSYSLEKVSLNQTYVAPQNDQVSVTFTSLPDKVGSLTIREVQLTEEQVQQLGALTDIAYDITSPMADGTFTYDLTLPNPQPKQNSQIKYSEDGTNFSDAEGETKDNQVVRIKGLNHFTVFVVTSPTPPADVYSVIDDGDASYTRVGSWHDNLTKGWGGDHDWIANSESGAYARWTFTSDLLPSSGSYRLFLHWTINTNHSDAVKYDLYDSGNSFVSTIATIDQTLDASGAPQPNGSLSDWKDVGVHSIQPGYYIQIDADNASAGNLVADAVRLQTVGSPAEVWVDDDWTMSDGTEVEAGKIIGWNAFPAIQEGINQAAANAVIHVMPGTYDESITIDKPLDMRGFNADIDPNTATRADEAIINGQSSVAVKIAADNVTVNGFTITNSAGSEGLGITNNSNLLIENNIISDINSANSTAHGITVVPSVTNVAQITIQNNLISDIHYTGSLAVGFSVAGIVAGWSDNTYTISNLIIQNNVINKLTSNISPWKIGHGAYGILFNNGAGLVNAQIIGNSISNLDGLWSHAIGLEGPTPNAAVTGNHISKIVDHKSPSDSVGVFFEANPRADSVSVNNNSFATSVGWGVAMHPDLMTSNPSILINAKNNWWGDATGPLDTINTDGSIPLDNLGGLGTGVFGKVDYSQWAVNSSFTFDAPVNLGWNIRSGSINPSDRPVDLACGEITNADYPIYANGKVSHNWELPTAPTNVKYQRQYQWPSSSSWTTDATSYTATNTPFATFGSAAGTEGEWNSRVRAWVDVNGNDSFDDGIDSVSAWSNECKITYDRTIPNAPLFWAEEDTSGVKINWQAIADATGYNIYEDDALIATVGAVTEYITSNTGTHTYEVRAVDAAGNESTPQTSKKSQTLDIVIDDDAMDSDWQNSGSITQSGFSKYSVNQSGYPGSVLQNNVGGDGYSTGNPAIGQVLSWTSSDDLHGFYNVYVQYLCDSSRGIAEYDLYSDGNKLNQDPVRIQQSVLDGTVGGSKCGSQAVTSTEGANWVSLGEYEFNGKAKIELTAQPGEAYIVADAVGFNFVKPSAPENLGWNLQSESATPNEPNLDLACNVSGTDWTNETSLANNWSQVLGTNIRYIRHNIRPDGSHIALGGNVINIANPDDLSYLASHLNGSYANNYTPWGSFGSNEGVYQTQVRAFSDLNSNGKFDLGEPISDWSNFCTIGHDISQPTVPGTPLPSPSSPTNQTSQVWNWTAATDVYSGIAGYYTRTKDLITNSWSNSWQWIGDVLGTSTSLEEGLWSLFIKAEDNAGNMGGEVMSATYQVDTTAPDLAVDSIKYDDGSIETGKFVTNFNTPSILGTTSSDVSTVDLTINGHTYSATLTGTVWEADITDAIPDGLYTMTVKATDFAGNTTTKTQNIRIDTSAPTAVYRQYDGSSEVTGGIAYVNDVARLSFTGEYTDSDPSANLYQDSYAIFEAQDDGSFGFSRNGKQAFCSWRRAPNLVDISGDNTFSLTTKESFTNCTSSLAEGEYYMAHQVYDTATRKDIPSINQFRDALGLHFVIDTTKPESSIEVPSNSGSNSVVYDNAWDGNIAGTATDNGTSASGLDHVELSIKRASDDMYWTGTDWTGTDESTRVMATGTDDWTYGLSSPAEDTYTIISHAVDKAGNVENSYNLTIVFDKTIPEVTLTINPADPDGNNGWYKTNPEITLVATDNNDPNHGFKQLEYQWDSQTGSWTTTTNTSVSFNPPGEGHYILYYRALDKAGNYSETGIKNISYDKTPLEEGPLNVSVSPNPTSGTTAMVTWNAAKDNITIDKYEISWQLDGTSTQYSKSVNSTTFEAEIDQLTEGKWNIKVKAFDGVGNSKEAGTELIVDRSAPDAPILSLIGTGTGTASLSWNAVDGATEYLLYYGTHSGDYIYGANVGGVTSYTVQGLGAGNYFFVVRAKDAADNQSPNSNEVSTRTISGAVGANPGALAQGFVPAGEVLGAEDQEATPAALKSQAKGRVAGVSTTACASWKSNMLWILLLAEAIILLAIEITQKRKTGLVKLLASLAVSLILIAVYYYLRENSCFQDGSFIALINKYFWMVAGLIWIVIRMIGYAFIEEISN